MWPGNITPKISFIWEQVSFVCLFIYLFIYLFIFKDFIYLFMIDIEREAETQAEGEAGSMQGARCGTRSWDSRIAPWAKGRRQTAEPPRDPLNMFSDIEIHLLAVGAQ